MMRGRTLILLLLAIILAGTTAKLTQVWLESERLRASREGLPVLAPPPPQSVLVARADLHRGQILRPEDLIWQLWPDGAADKNYLMRGGPRTPDSFAGWVVKNPIAGGEPISDSKIVSPADRGFLAAVLTPGTRAISVAVTVTSGISGFIFPGDRVDLLLSYPVPPARQASADAGRQNYEHKVSQTLLQDIRVIGIDQRLEGKPGEAVIAHTATFEVTPKQGEIIALASEIGKVSLTLRSLVPAPGTGSDAGVGAGDGGGDREPYRSPPGSPIGQAATYTMDSDISPLLPKHGSVGDAPASDVVTILRGKGNAASADKAQVKGL